MSLDKKKALIGFHADTRHGIDQAKDFLFALEAEQNVAEISSIYLVEQDDEELGQSETWGRFFSIVFRIETDSPPEDLLKAVLEIEVLLKKEAPRNFLQIYLLTYEDIVALDSRLNLPHPELHKKIELLVPASEVDSEYMHPVLQKKLNVLAAELPKVKKAEFYAQGKSLRESHL